MHEFDAVVVGAGGAGLYAAEECACVSAHGANRLGINSLVDFIVFCRRARLRMADYARQADFSPLSRDPSGWAKYTLDRLFDGRGGPQPEKIRKEMQEIMMRGVGIYRNDDEMAAAVRRLGDLRQEYKDIRMKDRNKVFNTELLDILELGNLLDLSHITAFCALRRTESWGAHARRRSSGKK